MRRVLLLMAVPKVVVMPIWGANNDDKVWFDNCVWNPSGKTGEVSLKLQNLVHFHAPFFTNHVYFTPRDRPSF